MYIPKYAVSVLWQWGDGTWNEQMLEPGYLEPMEHIFTQPGIYTTNIFVKYADGDVDAEGDGDAETDRERDADADGANASD